VGGGLRRTPGNALTSIQASTRQCRRVGLYPPRPPSRLRPLSASESTTELRRRSTTPWLHTMEQEFAPGDMIFDRYLVEGIIGSGGMATVYKCRDLRLDLEVAVKTLRRQFRRKPDIVQRFLREAKLQAKLRHPHIVQVTNVED